MSTTTEMQVCTRTTDGNPCFDGDDQTCPDYCSGGVCTWDYICSAPCYCDPGGYCTDGGGGLCPF
jgi:hypothetical protein